MSEKPRKKISSKRTLGAVLFVFAIFIFLYANIADLADVFTVWATLVLAGVAIFSFEESRRLREENRQKEERDRKERLLNEIIEWATDVAKCESLSPISELPILDFRTAGKELVDAAIEHRSKVAIAALGLRYQAIDTRSESIKIVAKKLDKSLGSNLHSAVRTTAKKLDTNIVINNKRLKGEATDQEYEEHWRSLVRSAVALSKKATSLID